MKPLIYFFLMIYIVSSCKSSNSLQKETISQKVSILLKDNRFNIECTQIYPTNTSSLQAVVNANLIPPGNTIGVINITGFDNYFKIHGDSISLDLPFYGEQQLSGLGYNRTNVGFLFSGIPKQFSKSTNTKKNIEIFNYSFDNGNESCKAQIKIHPQGNTDIYITSSHRSSISYRGSIKVISQ